MCGWAAVVAIDIRGETESARSIRSAIVTSAGLSDLRRFFLNWIVKLDCPVCAEIEDYQPAYTWKYYFEELCGFKIHGAAPDYPDKINSPPVAQRLCGESRAGGGSLRVDMGRCDNCGWPSAEHIYGIVNEVKSPAPARL